MGLSQSYLFHVNELSTWNLVEKRFLLGCHFDILPCIVCRHLQFSFSMRDVSGEAVVLEASEIDN